MRAVVNDGGRRWFEEHTGEVRVRLEARTLEALFEEAARALAELMLESPTGGADEPWVEVRLHARSRERLLYDWLNELVFLSETRKRVYTDVRVESVTETSLRGAVRGVFPESLRTAVKAATLHELAIEEGKDGGYVATVVFDV